MAVCQAFCWWFLLMLFLYIWFFPNLSSFSCLFFFIAFLPWLIQWTLPYFLLIIYVFHYFLDRLISNAYYCFRKRKPVNFQGRKINSFQKESDCVVAKFRAKANGNGFYEGRDKRICAVYLQENNISYACVHITIVKTIDVEAFLRSFLQSYNWPVDKLKTYTRKIPKNIAKYWAKQWRNWESTLGAIAPPTLKNLPILNERKK